MTRRCRQRHIIMEKGEGMGLGLGLAVSGCPPRAVLGECVCSISACFCRCCVLENDTYGLGRQQEQHQQQQHQYQQQQQHQQSYRNIGGQADKWPPLVRLSFSPLQLAVLLAALCSLFILNIPHVISSKALYRNHPLRHLPHLANWN